MTSSVISIYWSVDKRYSLGEENPDKEFLLIKLGHGIEGLGAIVLNAVRNIVYAKRNGMIPVIDMKSFENSYITDKDIGKVNGWEKFFLQPDQWHLEDIQNSKNIIESMTTRTLSDIDIENLGSYLKVQPTLKREVEDYCNKYFTGKDRILGVLVRGSDYTNMKPFNHCIQPDIDTVINLVSEKYNAGNFDLIYLCSEEERIVKLFCERFCEKVFYYPAARIKDDISSYLWESSLYRDNDPYRVGADYWVELCALSRCNALVAGDCSGTQVALLLNQHKYEDVYIFRLGRYGIDDCV